MAATLTSAASSNWADSSSGSEVTGTLSWNAGDRVLVVAVTEDYTVTLNTPTASGLTFAALGSPASTSSNCWIHAWQATAGASGSGAVTATVASGGTAAKGIQALAFGNCDGFVRTNDTTFNNVQTLSITRTQAGSLIVVASGDWSASGTAGLGWTPAGQTQLQAVHVAGLASMFMARWPDQGAAGTTAYGTTGLSGTKFNVVGIEVLSAASGPAAVTVTPAAATWSAVAVTPVPQPVQVSLTPATASWAAVSVSAQPSVTLTPATASWAATAVVPTPGQVSLGLTPATATWVGVPVTPVPQPVARTLTPATASWAAVPVTPVPQPAQRTLTPATATWAALQVSLVTPGAMSLIPAGASWSAQPVTPVPGEMAVTLTPAAASWSARPVTALPTVALTPAVAAWSARPVTPSPGSVTVALVPAGATWTAVPMGIETAGRPAVVYARTSRAGAVIGQSAETPTGSAYRAGRITSTTRRAGGIESEL